MKWQELIKIFNLDEKVEEFVKAEVAKLLRENLSGDGRRRLQSFNYEGHHRQCRLEMSHVPHALSRYETVRYGWLVNFCLGQEGEIDGSDIKIVTTNFRRGSADTPARAQGYWFKVSSDNFVE